MELADLSRPGEKKKLIWAAVLGVIAILFLWWTFIGFGSSKSTPVRTTNTSQTSGNRPVDNRAATSDDGAQIINVSDLTAVTPPTTIPIVQEPRRNIFAYLEKPVVAPTPVVTPTPTPTPTPPVLLQAISPSNVYAKTSDFVMELSGDKFTAEMRIFIDGGELPTKYKGPQQMTGSVSANLIANPGTRKVEVRTPDGRVYSNPVQLSIAPPPVPNYTYVGIFGTKHYVNTGLLQDKNNKEILSVQLGDLLGGRFRVTSISDRQIVFTDTNLKIKHTLTMTEGERTAGAPVSRPTPRVDAEDDEP